MLGTLLLLLLLLLLGLLLFFVAAVVKGIGGLVVVDGDCLKDLDCCSCFGGFVDLDGELVLFAGLDCGVAKDGFNGAETRFLFLLFKVVLFRVVLELEFGFGFIFGFGFDDEVDCDGDFFLVFLSFLSFLSRSFFFFFDFFFVALFFVF